MVMLVILAVMFVVYDFSAPDEVYEIREEALLATPAPAPVPTWTRYDVPLEDGLQRYIGSLCETYGVPTEIVLAIIERESDFDTFTLGDNGESYGLMQIWQSQHLDRCIRLEAYNLFEPMDNIRVGVDYLAELIDWGYGLDYALSWYNGNGGRLPCGYVDDIHARAEAIAATATIEIY